MRKLISVILAVTLLVTSVIGVSMFTASAETTADTVVMPTYVDKDGDPINVYHTMESLPLSVVAQGNAEGVGTVTAEPNTSNLPVDFLFGIQPGIHNYNVRINFDKVTGGKGAVFYVEVPEFDSYTLQLADSDGGEPNGDTKTATNFRLGIMIVVETEDGDLYTQQYARSRPVYTVTTGQTEWQAQTMNGNGVSLASGFKGYVYIPFSSLDENYTWTGSDTVVGIQFMNLTNAVSYDETSQGYVSGWTQLNGRPNPWYGWVPDGEQLLVSAPAIVTGDIDTDTDASGSVLDAEVSKPSAESVAYEGVSYGFFARDTGNLPATSATGTSITTAMNAGTVSVSAGTSGTVTITETTSLTPVTTKPSYTLTNYTNDYGWSKGLFTQNFKDGTAPTYNGTDYYNGFMFYVELPQITGDHALYPQFQQNGRSAAYLNTNAGKVVYYLPLGGTSWISTEERSTSPSNSNAVTLELDGAAFNGYIYIPFSSCNYAPNSSTTSFVSAQLNFYNPTDDNTASREYKVGSAILVETFDSSNVLAYTDDGLINLSNGLFHDNDYASADKFYGNETLPNYGSGNVLEFETPNDSLLMGTSVALGTNKVYDDSLTATFNYKVVNSVNPALKMPMMEASVHTAGTISSSTFAFVETDNYYTKDIDGFMVYIKNDSPTDKTVSLGTYAYWVETYTDAETGEVKTVEYGDGTSTGTSIKNPYATAKAYMLTEAGSWTTSAVTYNVIPANSGAYLYVPKTAINRIGSTGFCDNSDTYIYDVGINTHSTDYAVDDKLTVSFPMMVTNWTNENAGIAFVNGATVSQNIWIGDFAIPNDYDGTLTVNLLDLVQAKTEDTETNFAEFRANYLAEYFESADFNEVSTSFSLRSLRYSTATEDEALTAAYAELADNPDRGYRTEMSLYVRDGSPEPIYYSGKAFATLAEANAYITSLAEAEPTVELIQIGTGNNVYETTKDTEDTLVIDVVRADSGSGDGEYRVYRAFSDKDTASYFIRGSLHAKGNTYYVTEAKTITDTAGTESTVYRVKYDDRSIFTDWDETAVSEKLDEIFKIYFKTTDTDGSDIDQSNLFLAYIYITDWNGSTADDTTIVEELSTEALRSIEYFFKKCEEKNKKSMLRICYNSDFARNQALTDTQPDNRVWLAEQCANEGTIIRHTEQLAELIGKYKHTIHTISNGFIGFVGEMAEAYQYPIVDYVTVQKAIVENLCVPNGLFFSTRLPEYKQRIVDADPDWEYLDYISHNNDASYGEQTNDGWNSGGFQKGNPDGLATDWWEWMTKRAAYTPQGGEMYVQDKLIPDKVPTGMEMILQLAHHRHTSFSYWHGYLEGLTTDGNILKGWMQETLTAADLDENHIPHDPAWFADGEERNAYEFIRDHLGYRLVGQNVSLDWNGKASGKVNVSLRLKNYGFAAAFNMTGAFAILDADGNVVQYLEGTDLGGKNDPSKWYGLPALYYTEDYTGTVSASANSDLLTHTVSAAFDAPTESGKYYIGFCLKNSAGDTARLANDIETVNGYNILCDFTVMK